MGIHFGMVVLSDVLSRTMHTWSAGYASAAAAVVQSFSLFLDAEISVLEPQIWISALATPCGAYVVSATTLEAYLHYEARLLRDTLLLWIRDGHSIVSTFISLLF